MQNLIKNRHGNLVSDSERECTKCKAVYKRTSKTVTMCNKCNCERVKKHDLRKKMVARAKNRAKLHSITCTIKYTDVVIPEYCPIMGIKMEQFIGKSGGRKNSPSIDRIDNSKGYEPDNIQIISHLANQMKSQASPEELVKFAKWALAEYNALS